MRETVLSRSTEYEMTDGQLAIAIYLAIAIHPPGGEGFFRFHSHSLLFFYEGWYLPGFQPGGAVLIGELAGIGGN